MRRSVHHREDFGIWLYWKGDFYPSLPAAGVRFTMVASRVVYPDATISPLFYSARSVVTSLGRIATSRRLA